MSNSRKFKTKKIICSIVLCFGLLLSAMSGFNFSHYITKTVSASEGSYNNEHIYESIFSENSSDSNYFSFYTTSTSKPATANGWDKLETESTNFDNIKHGIVDTTDETTWNKETYETTRPTIFGTGSNSQKNHHKNLMINSYNGAGALGYKSNSISLEADSYYEIAVKLYTHRTFEEDGETIKTDPRASIYLTGLVEDTTENADILNKLKFEEINTLTGLETYTFFIETNEAKSVNLELWLGSKNSVTEGAVFFNEVSIKRCSEAYYADYFKSIYTTDEDNDEYNFINLQKESTSVVTNGNFEDYVGFSGWTKISQSTSDTDKQFARPIDVYNYTFSDNKTTIYAPGSDCSEDNEFALLMYNKESGFQGLESSEFTVEHHKYYKISFMAKSNCGTGDGANVKLVDKSNYTTTEDATLTIGTTVTEGGNKFRNDWTKYSFYIYGPATESKQLTIQIWLGTEDKETDGYVFIDNFTIENISYSDYNANATGTNSTAFNLNPTKADFGISNSFFDVTYNADDTTTYPLTPANWTRTGNEYNTFSGVVNTETSEWNANESKYYNKNGVPPTNPGKLPYMLSEHNNVLMMGSISETNKQTYKSTDFSLTSESYNKISFYVYTDYNRNIADEDYGASVIVKTASEVIIDYKNIHFDDNKWHKFEFYIKNGTEEKSASIQLNFEGVNGYVFFDDVMVETVNEHAYTNFGSLKDPANTYLQVDLSVEKFDNATYNSNKLIQLPNNWSYEEENKQNVNTFGIVSTEHSLLKDLDNTPSGNTSVLYINSTSDVYYSFISNKTYTFTAQTYYKISVNILTRNIAQDEPDADTTYGASFGLKESDEILIKALSTNEQWKTYTIYLCPESDTTSAIRLSLGSLGEPTGGEVLFDNLKVSTIDQATYEREIGNTEDAYYKAFINYVEPAEEEPEESEWENDFNWLIIPSLLTGIALIIAVVGYYIRKINFSRKPKVKTKYDRRKTLDRDIDRREKIELRKQIIAELNDELLAIDKEIEDFKALASERYEQLKEKITAEQERLKKQKLDIEIKKQEAKAEREKALKENPELISNKKAEKDYINYIAKLDKQEVSVQKELSSQEVKLSIAKEPDSVKLDKFLERKEYIRNEISKIEAEIEELAREEEDMWLEYKEAKTEAKKKKAEFKEQTKTTKAKTTKATTSEKETKTTTKKKNNKVVADKSDKKDA